MIHSDALFLQLAIILGLATILGVGVRMLKAPLLIAYILTGVILAALQLFDISTSQVLTYLPQIGIAFILFFVGMELDLSEFRYLGKAVVVTSLIQIVIALLVGLLTAQVLGFPLLESFYLGIGLSFSSTIVIIKLLLEKKDLSSLYGKLSLGITLVEDLVAVVLLMIMTITSSSFNLGLQNSLPLVALFLKAGLMFALALFFSRHILGRFFFMVAHSSELLFLTALAWCFIFVSVSLLLGFSVVIGAFLAGLALANSPLHFEIQGKVKPLRDFFVTLFFVYLGSQVVFTDLVKILPLIMIFILYTLILKPIIFLLILGAFGFRKHTIFQAAINLAHISEFSLIIMVVGLKLGVVSQSALSAMAIVGVISIVTSSLIITFSKQIYTLLLPIISFFERSHFTHMTESKKENWEMEDHIILIGVHRMGSSIIKFLKRERVPFLALDFNPEAVQKLLEEKIHALYGDIGDPEILDSLNLGKAKLIISTAQDIDDNLILLSEIKRKKVRAVIIVRAATTTDAQSLYQAGAHYVILPEIVSGDFVAQILKTHWPDMDFFKDRKRVELNKLSHNHLAFE